MSKNRVKLNICGSECVIGSDDSEGYVRAIGEEVETAMEDIVNKNDRVSVTLAAIITALSFCDESHKASSDTDNLRSQIKDYLEDSSHARMEATEAKREIERINRELQTLRNRLSEGESSVKDTLPEEVVSSKVAAPSSTLQKTQSGNYSRILPQNGDTPDQDGFMSFFEKKNNGQ